MPMGREDGSNIEVPKGVTRTYIGEPPSAPLADGAMPYVPRTSIGEPITGEAVFAGVPPNEDQKKVEVYEHPRVMPLPREPEPRGLPGNPGPRDHLDRQGHQDRRDQWVWQVNLDLRDHLDHLDRQDPLDLWDRQGYRLLPSNLNHQSIRGRLGGNTRTLL